MTPALVKYWVWRGQAYTEDQWKVPCGTCGEPTDYNLTDKQSVYLAADIEAWMEDFLEKHIATALREAEAMVWEEAAKLILTYGSKSSNPTDKYAPWMASPVYRECNEMAAECRAKAKAGPLVPPTAEEE